MKKSLLPDGRAAGVNETDLTAGGAGPWIAAGWNN